MRVLRQVSDLKRELKRYSKKGLSVGFVPTMGALHRGHARLISAAAKSDDVVVVSIFVNPLQFGPSEDYSKYPRDLKADAEICRQAGADLVFAPDAASFLKMKSMTKIRADRGLKSRLCGPFRPGHFDGVVTIVAHFFKIIRPHRAYFGLKDYQQYVVIREMTERLFGQRIEIVPVPTVREASGLAMSSRNRYLTASEKRTAPKVYQALNRARGLVRTGKATATRVLKFLRVRMSASAAFRVQYLEIADARTLRPIPGTIDPKKQPVVIAAAVYLGTTRLIDNVLV